jgi:hypothetical protein
MEPGGWAERPRQNDPGRTARVERAGSNGPESNGSEISSPSTELRPVSTKPRPGRGEDAGVRREDRHVAGGSATCLPRSRKGRSEISGSTYRANRTLPPLTVSGHT